MIQHEAGLVHFHCSIYREYVTVLYSLCKFFQSHFLFEIKDFVTQKYGQLNSSLTFTHGDTQLQYICPYFNSILLIVFHRETHKPAANWMILWWNLPRCVLLCLSGVSGHEHDRLLPHCGTRWHPERRQRRGHHWSCHHVLLRPLCMVSRRFHHFPTSAITQILLF